MKMRMLLGMCVFMGGTLAMTQSVSASDKKSAEKKQKAAKGHEGHGHEAHADGGMDTEAAMTEMWAQMSAPGEFHKHLEVFVGDWNYVVRMRFTPDAEWSQSPGVATTKWILGGRYTLEDVKGTSPEMPFHGMGITGYDKTKKKFVSTWMDTMGTSMMSSMGTCDDSGKVFTYKGTRDDPMTGQRDSPFKWVIRVVNNGKFVGEGWKLGPDGKMFMDMEITYTRK